MGHFFFNIYHYYYTGFCKNSEDSLKKHSQEICKNRNCQGESCLKWQPKSGLFLTTFGDCKLGEYCRYHHERKKTLSVVKSKCTIQEIDQIKANATKQNKKVNNKTKQIIQYFNSNFKKLLYSI